MEEKKEIITTEEELESLIAVAASKNSKKIRRHLFWLVDHGCRKCDLGGCA